MQRIIKSEAQVMGSFTSRFQLVRLLISTVVSGLRAALAALGEARGGFWSKLAVSLEPSLGDGHAE
jgi:hypothetical protein